jgi:fimbrial isopeptide formation D2 family protein
MGDFLIKMKASLIIKLRFGFFAGLLIVMTSVGILSTGSSPVSASTLPPVVDVNMVLVATGTATTSTDPTSWSGNGDGTTTAGETNPGKDSTLTDKIVKSGDEVDYRVTTNLIHADSNNVFVTLTVTNATWIQLPQVCLTTSPTPLTTLSPVSSISSDKRTLVCNLGFQKQGVVGTFIIQSKADFAKNDTSITAQAVSAGTGATGATSNPDNAIITGSPKVDIVKDSDRIVTPTSTSYEPSYIRNVCYTGSGTTWTTVATTGTPCPGAVEGDILKFNVTIKHEGLGSEKLSAFNVLFPDNFRYAQDALVGVDEPKLVKCDQVVGTNLSCSAAATINSGTITEGLDFNIVGTAIPDNSTADGIVAKLVEYIFVPRTDVPIAPTVLMTSNLVNSSSFIGGSADPQIHSVSGIPNQIQGNSNEYAQTCSNPAVTVGLGGNPSSCNNKWGLPLQAYAPGGWCASKEFTEEINLPGYIVTSKCNGPYTTVHVATPGSTAYPTLYAHNTSAEKLVSPLLLCDVATKTIGGQYLSTFSGKLGEKDGDQVGFEFLNFGAIGGWNGAFYLNNGVEKDFIYGPNTKKYADGSLSKLSDIIDRIQFSVTPIGSGATAASAENCGLPSDNTGWFDWDQATNSVPGAGSSTLTKFRLITKTNIGADFFASGKTNDKVGLLGVAVSPQIVLNSNPSIFTTFAAENNAVLPSAFTGILANFGSALQSGVAYNNVTSPRIGTNNPYTAADQVYDRLNALSDLLYILPSAVTLEKSASVYAANAGDTVTYTLTPAFMGSAITDTISIVDTYDTAHMDLVIGSVTGCSATVVASGCSYTVSGNVITFTIANQQAGVGITPIQYQGKIKSTVTNADIPNTAEATAVTDPAAHNGDGCTDIGNIPASCTIKAQRQGSATIRVRTSGAFQIEKKVTKTVRPTNTDLRYDLYSKDLSADPIAPQQYIDIFPHNADNAGTTSRVNPSVYTPTSTIAYGNLSAERVDGAGTVSTVTPTQLLWTTANPTTINQDPKCASNTGGVSSTWPLDSPASTSLSSANPNANDWSLYCPAGDAVTTWNTGIPSPAATAIKWIMPALSPNDSYHFTLDLKARGNKEADKYTNNFSSRAPSVVAGAPTPLELPIISNDVTIVVVDGSIGDRVWYDTNRNGTQDSGELGIPSVPIKLTSAGPDGILGDGINAASADDQIFTTTTNGSGDYLFSFLPNGTFSVEVTTQPNNTLPTYDLDDTSPSGPFVTPNKTITTLTDITNPSTGELTAIQDRTNVDFGYVQTGLIGDTVYYDNNNNGVYDPNTAAPSASDVGINGVTVQLKCPGIDGILGDGVNTASADDMILTATTGDNPDTPTVVEKGYYQFKNIPFSPLCVVTVTTPPSSTDYIQSGDPDATKDNKATLPISLASPSNQSGDFGYAPKGQVGDTIFEDTNRNGSQDSGEPGIQGVLIRFICPGIDGILGDGVNAASADDMLLGSATTDANGKYSITNLPYNPNCSVKATLPVDYELTSDPDATKDGDTVLPLTLVAKSNLTGDFGYAPLASLGDYIWADSNKNGLQDPSEAPLSNVRIELLDANGAPVADPHSTTGVPYILTSTSTGFYRFTGLKPGTYKVKFSNLPSGSRFTQVLGDNTTAGSDASTDGFTQTVTLAAGQSNLTLDAGVVLADSTSLSNTGTRQLPFTLFLATALIIVTVMVGLRVRRIRGYKA